MKARVEVVGGEMDGVEKVISSNASIGRDKSCDISIPVDRYVSKKHAVLRFSQEGCLLEDLASTNGTFIEDEPLKQPTALSNGQIFKVGKTSLKISYD